MNPAIYYLSSLPTYIKYVPTELPLGNGQIWDQYNLNTSVYNDLTPIPVGIGWTTLTTGACRFYNNDSSNGILFGRLYNWYAVNGIYNEASLNDPDLRKNIAPEGWRVAEISDWQALYTYVNNLLPTGSVGNKLKEIGSTYWSTGNAGTNLIGFGARGGGIKAATNSGYAYIYSNGYWWPFGATSDNQITMAYNSGALNFSGGGLPNRGLSVRLIKRDIEIQGFATILGAWTAKSVETGGFLPLTTKEDITEIGIVWGTVANPNIIANNVIEYLPLGLGEYRIDITSGLLPSTEYHIRAYAKINNVGTAYADDVSFTTDNGFPVVTTDLVDNIEAGSAIGHGTLEFNGGFDVTQSGFCWSDTIDLPTILNSPYSTDGPTGDGPQSITSNIINLSKDKVYVARAYAKNIYGTSYGEAFEFQTPKVDLLKHGYSLRRVVPEYTGPAIQVRITARNGSTFKNIGFDANGDLDTAYLLSVVATTSTAAVSIWYDQTGSGKNFISAVTGRSPRIVNVGGVLVTRNGRPALNCFTEYLCNMQLSSVSLPQNNLSVFIVCSNYTFGGTQRAITAGGMIFPYVYGGTDRLWYNNNSRVTLGVTSSDVKIYTMLSKPTEIFAWKNDEPQGGWLGSTNTIISAMSFGGYPNEFQGYVQEMLFYDGDVNDRSGMTLATMDYYSISTTTTTTTTI